MKAFQFKIQLLDIQKPPVWRRVLVPAFITLDQFHAIIQAAFGWEEAHLYQFCSNGWSSDVFYKIPDEEDDERVEDSQTTFLADLFNTPKQTFTYLYDFGDNWEHKITLEEITETDKAVAVCLTGKGTCPPEDCGGAPGYAHLLEVLNDPKHPEHKDMKNWLGLQKNENWDDVYAFDKQMVNADLADLEL